MTENVILNKSDFRKKIFQITRWSIISKSFADKKSSKQIIEKYVDAKYMVQVQHIFV